MLVMCVQDHQDRCEEADGEARNTDGGMQAVARQIAQRGRPVVGQHARDLQAASSVSVTTWPSSSFTVRVACAAWRRE